MKIRTRFTLLISCTVLLAAGLVYAYVLSEMLEERYRQIDRELLDIATCLLAKATAGEEISEQDTDFPLDRYWILVSNQNGKPIYQSRLSRLAQLPDGSNDNYYFASTEIPVEALWIEPEEEDEKEDLSSRIRFRVLYLHKEVDNQSFTLKIGKPIPLLMLELKELSLELLLLTILFVGTVFAASYAIAGKLLQPLHNINRLTRKIRESSLDQRIPLGKSRDELYTLSVSLNSMFDRLESSFQMQKEFVSNASHELKSPLTILRLGHEDMLGDDLPEDIRTELQKQLLTIQRMQKLVHDLLDISRLEQGDKLNRKQLNLSKLIGEVLDDYTEVMNSRQIRLEISLGNWSICADRDMLRRLFVNLIDNAIKYNSSSDGSIEIDITGDGDELTTRIANTGSLLPPEELSAVFEQFYRVEKSRSSKYGGTGLGLTIARRIVELHGGAIKADSDARVTTFTVTLPRHLASV